MNGQGWITLALIACALFVVYELYSSYSKRRKARKQQQSVPAKVPVRTAEVKSGPTQLSAPQPVALAPAYTPPPPPPSPPKTDTDWRAELAAVTTPEECLDVYNGVPHGDPIEDEAKVKLLSFLNVSFGKLEDIDECWTFREEIVSDLSLDWDETNALVRQALEKALGFITTFKETKDFFVNLEESEEDTDLIEQAVKKMLDLATFDECFDALDAFSNYSGHDEAEDTAFRKALSLASDADECERVRSELSLSDDEDDEVLLKQVGFLDSVEDCESIWDDQGIDSVAGSAAILRAAELIKQESAET